MSELTSRQNPKYKTWLSLLEAKGIHKHGLALISGSKLIREFAEQSPQRLRELLVGPKMAIPNTQARVHHLSAALFKDLDVIGTRAPLAVVELPEIQEFVSAPAKGLEVVAALSDPGNLGALLRSAEAFGARRVILTQESASPFLPKAIRASAGACFRLPLAKAGPLAELNLTEAYGLDMDGQDLTKLAWPKNLFLVLGEEGQGLPEPLALTRLKIPMSGRTESLNAVVAASIALFSWKAARP